MASTSSHHHNKKRTRLQNTSEKRRAEEELRQEAELKRQKKIFRVGDVIGPRDVVVNSNLSKLQQRTNKEIRPTLKQEPLEIESSLLDESHDSFHNSSFPQIKLEVDSSLVVKTEETLELEVSTFEEILNTNFESIEHTESYTGNAEHQTIFSDTGQSDHCSEIALEAESHKFWQNHIQILKSLNYQKDQEVNKLTRVINGLNMELNIFSDTELENVHIILKFILI